MDECTATPIMNHDGLLTKGGQGKSRGGYLSRCVSKSSPSLDGQRADGDRGAVSLKNRTMLLVAAEGASNSAEESLVLDFQLLDFQLQYHQHGEDTTMPLKFDEPTPRTQKTLKRRKRVASPRLKWLAKPVHKLTKKPQTKRNFDNKSAFFGDDDDDIEDSIHLAKQRLESNTARLRWEETHMELEDIVSSLVSPSLSESRQRTTRASAA
mmetsp:Transcript_27299/g.45474  ORF Transcript_27299/g.45474 Transcript_27299/m.45474 type:complete len:210 (+) Transcript_27299:236-865(+)|eukprot:CAMPEP_0119022650 /NCGR_PEP_ID=MMETSP1176-20130426/28482_1 /TAXON_ID=265551 /ORGANISM="Synedropsis recta cf, Strain CCMP1620" /LENGTH=209 /DNA_ID=CAMNT_0006977567 /DNA_START=224 /DNA_END=853 /DNA_ORIENTATION=+